MKFFFPIIYCLYLYVFFSYHVLSHITKEIEAYIYPQQTAHFSLTRMLLLPLRFKPRPSKLTARPEKKNVIFLSKHFQLRHFYPKTQALFYALFYIPIRGFACQPERESTEFLHFVRSGNSYLSLKWVGHMFRRMGRPRTVVQNSVRTLLQVNPCDHHQIC